MADEEQGLESLEDQLERIVAQLGNFVSAGLVQGLEESGVIRQMLELLQALQKRVEGLEQEVDGLRKKDQVRKPVVVPSMTMPVPRSPQVNLTASRMRSRTRTASRPTVTYRVDPRAAPKPESPEQKECSEAGCQRQARSRGLCSLHYQRLRYRERKIEHKQESVEALPPPPPPTNRRAITTKQRNGGTKGIFALLYDEKGCKLLAGLINQMKYDRSDLTQRLNNAYAEMPGVPLDDEDVVRVVHYHKLGEALRKRESEIICRHLTKQRGSLFKSAQKMKMDPDQLKRRIKELNLEEETAKIRNDFKDEILEASSFNQRLDLALTREKYLEDLGIAQEVDESLRRELTVQIEKLANGADPQSAGNSIREALSLDEERFRRLLRRFELESTFSSPEGGTPVSGGQ